MNELGGWFRQFLARLTAGFRNFMVGRYGTDRLNMAILGVGLVASLLSVIIRFAPLNLVFFVLSYGMMFWAIFRTLSRKTYQRYQENRKFLSMVGRLKDRQHRYFRCPKCRQRVRVPRGKGRVAITCPKCRERFERNA